MTRITVLGYTIAADNLNWTLYEHRRTGAEAREPGKPYEVPVGYYSRLPQAIDALVDHRLRHSDARSLKELAKELASIKQIVEEAFAAVEV